MVHPSLPFVSLTAALVGLGALAPAMSTERDRHKPPAPVSCAELASAPTLGSPSLSVSANVALSGSNVAYCQVNLLYSTSPEQNINIRVGLPLNSVDGGTGGVEGAWNGRTQGIGGGGCAGSLNVDAPVNAGYVGSGTDTGHTGGSCEPGVNRTAPTTFSSSRTSSGTRSSSR